MVKIDDITKEVKIYGSVPFQSVLAYLEIHHDGMVDDYEE